jgi:hypothetical protein
MEQSPGRFGKFRRDPVARPVLTHEPRGLQMDILYLAFTVGFFALSWALIVLCERLS